VVVGDRAHLGEDAAGGDHLVARRQLGQHRPVVGLPLPLGPDEEKPEDRAKRDEKNQRLQRYAS
jgi:hypothetical protein